MRTVHLSIICLLASVLGACSVGQPVTVNYTAAPVPRIAQQDMLSLGRALSFGTVDIYEPGLTVLSVPDIVRFTPREFPIPLNQNFIVRDRSVTAYSLDSLVAQQAPAGSDFRSPFNLDGTLR